MQQSGAVVSPVTRAGHYLPGWVAGTLAAGKFFPETGEGLNDRSAPTDVRNVRPPADGAIASAGQPNARELDAVSAPDGGPWAQTPVEPGTDLTVVWQFGGSPVVRRFAYFLTRAGWDSARPLARDQFEAVLRTENPADPYFMHLDELRVTGPAKHAVPLPRRTGHHVLLAVCEIADTGEAYYQTIDLDFGAA